MNTTQCVNCRQMVPAGSGFCSNCGAQLGQYAAQKTIFQNKQFLYLVGGILGLLVLVCGLCGIAGMFDTKKKPANTETAANTNQTVNSAPKTLASAQPAATIYANFPELANKTVAEVESKLGVPANVRKVENIGKMPDFVEGEMREYKVNGKKPIALQIFFYKGKAVEFTVESVQYDDKTNTAEEFAGRFGFVDTKIKPADKTEKDSTVWSGKFGETEFKEIDVRTLRGYYSNLKASVKNEEIEKIKAKKDSTETDTKDSSIKTLKSETTSSKYIRGPRGGCYYITSSGSKEYVDKSLCN
ncbi:MAG: zinc ribbon domain-containing protein [Pyrinomonadaceae bacterium]